MCTSLLFWGHLFSTSAMVGIIWFVQIVHYPLFREVGQEEHDAYHRGHMSRTAWVIAPIMLLELGTGFLLCGYLGIFASPELFLLSLGALGLIWVSTFLVQVRYHRRLDHGKEGEAIEALITSNWVRTWLWTLRPVLIVLALT